MSSPMNLPPLPEPEYPAVRLGINRDKLAYTADQMHAYGEACAAAEREACAACLDKASSEYMANATANKYLTDYGRAIMTSASDWAETMAAAIRARGET